MKSLKEQTKEVAYVCLALGIVCMLLGSGCSGPIGATGATGKGNTGDTGSKGDTGDKGDKGDKGDTGNTGAQGYGAGIRLTAVSPGVDCAGGGTKIETFQDLDNSGFLDLGEPLIALSYVCNGVNGNDGTNGSNTTFSVVADSGAHCTNGGFDVTFTDYLHSTTEYVCNGVNGANGQAGTNGTNGSNGGTVSFSLVQAILPCGYASSPWKEVILGLQGGQLLSSFSESASGLNTRFSFVPNGSYNDTDSSGCNFTVTGDGSTWSQIQWNGGTNAYSTWPAGGYNWTQPAGWVALP